MFKVARTYCQNEEDQQDVVQEIRIQLWQSYPKYDDKFKITTWIYRIAINVAISFYRKNTLRQQKKVSLNEQINLIETLNDVEKEQQLNLLEQFISELKELDKALMLLYLEEKSHKEIAEIIGISETNVATKVGRIKANLKERFSKIKNY